MLDPYNAFVYREENPAGGSGSLAGKTVGVKANIAVKGMPFHAGIGAREDRIAQDDAEVVRLLRKAGASITGILNMEEGALGAKTDNPHFGPAQNPHAPKEGEGYSPGGSSGGCGAAVAAGLCDIALGTDTMGSVRIPAAHCGVYGFKPATDRVSQEGLEPADLSLDAIGVLARNLGDLEVAARTMSDFGEGMTECYGAVLIAHGVGAHLQVATTFETTIAMLDHPPAQVQLSQPNSRIRFAGFIQVSKAMAEHFEGVQVSDHLAKLLTYGPKRSAADWAEDQAIIDQARDEVRAIVDAHTFLMMPTVPNPPFAHNEKEPAAQADFTCLANIAGLPAISLPMASTSDGLPMGVQIVGKAGYEKGLFEFARDLDDKLGAYHAPKT
jgi:aspartyl-tRNA(Asn)/glutamyl-tRNA(Gln) amidotransferase subunit A